MAGLSTVRTPMNTLSVVRIAGLVLVAQAALWAQSKLEFVDLRLQGGLVETQGYGGALTLMAGNIGTKDPMLEVPDDLGLVLGLRGSLAHQRVKDGDDQIDTNLAAAHVLGGFGYYVNKRQHCELYVGYGLGRPTLTADHGGFHNDGNATVWTAECGWHYTRKSGTQFGIVGGWSWTRVEFQPAEETSPSVFAQANGFNLMVSVGHRF